MRQLSLAAAILAMAGCNVAGVDGAYSDTSRGVAGGGGFPELARELGALSHPDCVMERPEWEAAFIERNITTSRRVTNALRGMTNNGQAIYFQDRGVLAITAEFCQP